jgi:hypothetical protein
LEEIFIHVAAVVMRFEPPPHMMRVEEKARVALG